MKRFFCLLLVITCMSNLLVAAPKKKGPTYEKISDYEIKITGFTGPLYFLPEDCDELDLECYVNDIKFTIKSDIYSNYRTINGAGTNFGNSKINLQKNDIVILRAPRRFSYDSLTITDGLLSFTNLITGARKKEDILKRLYITITDDKIISINSGLLHDLLTDNYASAMSGVDGSKIDSKFWESQRGIEYIEFFDWLKNKVMELEISQEIIGISFYYNESKKAYQLYLKSLNDYYIEELIRDDEFIYSLPNEKEQEDLKHITSYEIRFSLRGLKNNKLDIYNANLVFKDGSKIVYTISLKTNDSVYTKDEITLLQSLEIKIDENDCILCDKPELLLTLVKGDIQSFYSTPNADPKIKSQGMDFFNSDEGRLYTQLFNKLNDRIKIDGFKCKIQISFGGYNQGTKAERFYVGTNATEIETNGDAPNCIGDFAPIGLKTKTKKATNVYYTEYLDYYFDLPMDESTYTSIRREEEVYVYIKGKIKQSKKINFDVLYFVSSPYKKAGKPLKINKDVIEVTDTYIDFETWTHEILASIKL